MFKRPGLEAAVEEELCELQGTQDVLTYITLFKQLATETTWVERTFVTLFNCGLRDGIKDELMQSTPFASLKELMDLVLNIEYRLRERRIEKRRSRFQFQSVAMHSSARHPEENQSEKPASSEEEPMQIDVARGLLSEVERENKQRKDLCLYCGSAGHPIRMCPSRPTRPSEEAERAF
ncbi:hypothetical protein NDU88_001535 [Pleurodeles waltl]|uniref:CCHC-type domain-containing protein n=1 Tax=Pleurodeles waltl TaxID=8319 RepID=A0AAV7LHP3_PLEWA|nr:hypothetical protein NDU88_001535 [Pleurodeles waltl]